jgi:hypothetical protein
MGIFLYICMASMITLLAGCQHLTPTKVPPLTDELGFSVVNYKGWTTVGLNQWAYKIHSSKLDTWGLMMDMVNNAALQARDGVIDLWSMAATAGTFGGIPLALRKVPPGYVRKEDE